MPRHPDCTNQLVKYRTAYRADPGDENQGRGTRPLGPTVSDVLIAALVVCVLSASGAALSDIFSEQATAGKGITHIERPAPIR